MPPVKPECDWVEAGEGFATLKLDGTNVKVDDGQLYKRKKPKDRDYDNASYVLVDLCDPGDKWIIEAYLRGTTDDGIYEAIGPKIQGNHQHVAHHQLVRVLPPAGELRLASMPRTFDELCAFMMDFDSEGLVFHHPDGRLAKIKRRDFGLPWPPLQARSCQFTRSVLEDE